MLGKLELSLFKPRWDYQFKYEREDEKVSGCTGEVTP